MIMIPTGNGGFTYIPTPNHYKQTTKSEENRPHMAERYTTGEILGITSCALLIVILNVLLACKIADRACKGE